MTSPLPLGTLGLVASLLAATLYQGNHDRNWNIVSENLTRLGNKNPLKISLNNITMYTLA